MRCEDHRQRGKPASFIFTEKKSSIKGVTASRAERKHGKKRAMA